LAPCARSTIPITTDPQSRSNLAPSCLTPTCIQPHVCGRVWVCVCVCVCVRARARESEREIKNETEQERAPTWLSSSTQPAFSSVCVGGEGGGGRETERKRTWRHSPQRQPAFSSVCMGLCVCVCVRVRERTRERERKKRVLQFGTILPHANLPAAVCVFGEGVAGRYEREQERERNREHKTERMRER